MQLHTETVSGEVPNDHDRPPPKFAQGRVCAECDCTTQLSVYNESEYCSLHLVGLAPRVRGRKSGWPRGRRTSSGPGQALAIEDPARASFASTHPGRAEGTGP